MEYRILGPLEVIAGDRPVVLPRGRGRALLAILVLHAGEVVSTERLIDELWGEAPPPTVATALHNLVSDLRRRLEPARASGDAPTVLKTCPPGYVVAIDRGEVDANRFRHLVEGATGEPAAARAAQLRSALALWRGQVLADFTYEPFAQAAITELEELRLAAVEQRIEADLALGRHAELVAELEGLCAEHPLRERPRGQLMVALYRCGRQAEALRAFAAARRLLVDELGVEPGPQLRRLERAILDQDPSLDLLSAAPERTLDRSDVMATGEASPWLPPGRKLVTVVFVDLTATSGASEADDPEAVREVVRRGYDVVAAALEHHGATVEAFIGDVVVAVFGAPVAHEDDALRALRAMIELSEAVARLNGHLDTRGLAVRVGVNTGEVIVGDPGTASTALSGTTVKWAARLQQAAAHGEVLVGDTTRLLVEDVVLLQPVAGLVDRGGQPARAWRLLDVAPGAPTTAPLDTPIVGRTLERARLRAAFDRAVVTQRCRRVTVLGEAGIGKSRLVRELAGLIAAEARVLTGRCPAYGDGITFWPLREVVLEAAGERGHQGVLDVLAGEKDQDSVGEAVAVAIGVTEGPGRGAELFPAVRRYLEALARGQPFVVVLEDMHWAQPTFLDLVEYLTESTGAPVLLVCLARPELLETRPTWAENRDHAEHLVLQPLGREDSEKLLADRLGTRRLPADTVARILETAQGNPLFLEQLLAELRGRGEPEIPPSIQALLAARLDRLGPAERDLLRCAAVAGTAFSVPALAALVPDQARPFVRRHLLSLEHKELVAPAHRALLGEPAFAFRHVLIQLAAARSITRLARSELHERFAQWLESRAGDRSAEFEEIIGYHLEQAHDERRSIGLHDEHTGLLAERAGERLARAGLRAYERYDMAGAANLLSRARSLLPSPHSRRRALLRSLAAAYQQLGRLREGDTMLAELLDEVVADCDQRTERAIRLERTRIRLFSGPDPTPLSVIRQEAERVLEAAGASADELAQACHVLALVHLRGGRVADMEQVARLGLAHADRSGNPRDELAARWSLAWALEAGSTPIADAIRTCVTLARWRGREHPGVLCELASLRAALGQFDQARELIDRGRRLMQEWMHVSSPLVFATRSIATVDILAGDPFAAERHLRSGLEIALEMGIREQVAELAAGLSRILSAVGASGEAGQFATLSMKQAPSESVGAQARWRAAMARVRHHHEEPAAEHQARLAAELPPADMLNLRGELLFNLAEILLGSGQHEAARRAAAEAAELYRRKGNVVSVGRAYSLMT